MLIANQKIKYFLLLASSEILLLPNNANAQRIDTYGQTNLQLEENQLYLPEELLRLKFNISEYLPNNRSTFRYFPLNKLPERINFEQIKVIGNTIFSTTELQSIVNLEKNQTVDKRTLRKFIQRINQTYRQQGYITSGVFTEPKIQTDGSLIIQVTEGKIEDIKITGLTRLRSNYIRQRLVREPGQILNQKQLKKELELLRINRLIENISATVTGSKLGSHVLEVEVEEADQFYTELSLDNLGSPTFGSSRRQLKINHNNLLGYGDRIFAAYTNTDGSNFLNSINYNIPVNSRDGIIGIDYRIGKFEAIDEPFEDLDIDFENSGLGIAYRQPFYQTPTQEFALGLALSRVASETTLLDFPFPIYQGADDQGELNISAIRFYQDYTKRGKKDRFDLRSELSLGVDIFDATDNDGEFDTNFFIWRGQTSYLRKLTNHLTLSFKSYMQLSDRALVSFELAPRRLFNLGTEETFILRGYRQNSLVSDNGVFATAELQGNVGKIPDINATLQVIPFVDFGTAWNSDDTEFIEPTLVSVGLGLRMLVNDNFRARVDWGVPLVDLDFNGDSLQEEGVTFNLEYRPL